jgi:hypothetical protein
VSERERLARYLMAAGIASSMRVGLQYAYNKWVRDNPRVGELWYALADAVLESRQEFAETLKRQEKGTVQ